MMARLFSLDLTRSICKTDDPLILTVDTIGLRNPAAAARSTRYHPNRSITTSGQA